MTKFITLEDLQKEDSKTKFTHELSGSSGWVADYTCPEEYDKVIYLGHCEIDGDLFACYFNDSIQIFKGYKGREFCKQ